MEKRMSSPEDTPDNDAESNIVFNADDKDQCHELSKVSMIHVTGSTGNHDHGSSKIKLKNLVDYKWEVKNYPGHLIAIHMNGDFIAYAIKVSNKASGTEGMVRVVSSVTGDRLLMKGMSDEILDLQFAHLSSKVMLACIEATALHIHSITRSPMGTKCVLILKIVDPINGHVPTFDSVSWCPFVKDISNEENDEDEKTAGHSIVWTRGKTFQCYCTTLVTQQYGEGTFTGEQIVDGCIKFSDQTSQITCAKFSPDGTTLAVSTDDGFIRCYQVYFFTKASPRRLHEWVPHNNKPVNSFFFLDNLSSLSYSGQNLWKYCITFADNNTELKLWSCELWQCLQTIKFDSPHEGGCQFKAELDRTSSYLVMSDQKNRGVFVLQIIKSDPESVSQDGGNGENKNDNSTVDETSSEGTSSKTPDSLSSVYIKSIAEFPVSSPILSFGIVNAAIRKYKCGHPDDIILNELDDYDEESNAIYCVAIRMFIVQPKSVQECHLLYTPTVPRDTDVIHESLTDISVQDKIVKSVTNSEDERACSVNSGEAAVLEQLSAALQPQSQSNGQIVKPQVQPHINLMTPEAFNSPGKQSEVVSTEVMATLLMLAQVTTPPGSNGALTTIPVELTTNTVADGLSTDVDLQLAQAAAEALDNLQPSGGSSPSREVCEILTDCLNENEFFENSPADLDENEDDDDNDEVYPNATEQMITSIAESLNFKTKSTDDQDGGSNITCIPAKVTPNSTTSTRSDEPWPKVPKVPSVRATTNSALGVSSSASNAVNSQQMDQMSAKLDQILRLMQAQSFEITDLRSQVAELEKSRIIDNTENNQFAQKIETRLSKMLGEYLIRYEREHSKKLEAFMTGRDTQNRELLDSVVHTVTPIICTEVNTRLTALVMAAFNTQLIPAIGSMIDIIKQQVQSEVAKKLTASDKVIGDSLSRLCQSKDMAEHFGSAVAIGVRDGLKDVYTNSIKNILVPNFEKSINVMMRQISASVTNNLTTHSTTIKNHMAQYKTVEDRTGEVLDCMRQMNDNLQTSYEAVISSCIAHLSNDMAKDLKLLQANVNKSVRDTIKNEIQKGFESQVASLEDSVKSAVRSQAQTPAPSIFDVQEQIKQFLSQGQINKAFHQALLANDLALVEFTLERADLKAVFHPTCQLEQTVLLSLVQQITADMSTFNQLKLNYLFDAILCLDVRDPITKEHAPKVVRELCTNCQNFAATTDNAHLASSLKMALLSIQGMGFKLF